MWNPGPAADREQGVEHAVAAHHALVVGPHDGLSGIDERAVEEGDEEDCHPDTIRGRAGPKGR